MILLLVLAAVIAPGFAASDRAISYRVRDTFAARTRQIVTTTETLSFTHAGGAIVAHLVTTARSIEAPPEAKDALVRLFGPLTGIETRLRLDPQGRPAGLIDTEKPWAAFLASRAALRAKFDADPKLPPAALDRLHKALDAETDPATRDARLSYPFSRLLPPALPPLSPGASANFRAAIQTPGGTLPGDGTVTLLAADRTTLRYRITLATAPIAPSQACYAEASDLAIDRMTGLLIAAHEERRLIKPGGEIQPISSADIDRLP